MAKINTIPTPTKPTPSSKASHRGKSNLTNERGRAKQRTASIGVATGVSEAVSEVHHPKKSRQTNKESNSVIQQNANKKIKCIDSDNIKTHRITKTSKPSVTTHSPQIAVQKSPDALNVKRQLKFKGNSVTNPYLKTNCYVSPFMSLTKMTTFPAPSSVSISPAKVSPLKSPKKKNRTQRNDSLMKSELQSEPVPNKLHAYKIDWIDKNITTAEAKKYPHFTEIKRRLPDWAKVIHNDEEHVSLNGLIRAIKLVILWFAPSNEGIKGPSSCAEKEYDMMSRKFNDFEVGGGITLGRRIIRNRLVMWVKELLNPPTGGTFCQIKYDIKYLPHKTCNSTEQPH